MRYVFLDDVEEGNILGSDLIDEKGRIIAAEDTPLTAKMIARLTNYKIDGVYIKDELTKDIKIECMIPPEVKAAGIRAVQQLDVNACQEVSQRIVSVLSIKKPLPSLDLLEIRSYDDVLYSHSVNVGMICCVIGMAFDLPDVDLQNLVFAGMLHDFGKTSIPKEILNKPSRLTTEEYAAMKKHPEMSIKILEKKQYLPKDVADAILHHHENYDGTGYPDGQKGEDQSLFTRILHVADVYDALISKRSFKEPYSAKDTVEYMMGGCGSLFDAEVVGKLLQYVPIYNKGSQVVLTDGRQGIVSANEGVHNLRPIIRLMNGKSIDLADRENMSIGIINFVNGRMTMAMNDEESRKEMINGSSKKKIVVVDDMKTNLMMLNSLLAEDYEVVLLKSGMQAIAYATSHDDIDLIIMDINMPGMNGMIAAREIFKQKGRIPLVFVTEISDRDVIMQCLDLKVSGYIIRPYNPDFVKSEIARIISTSK